MSQTEEKFYVERAPNDERPNGIQSYPETFEF